MADRAKDSNSIGFELLAITGLCMLFSTPAHAFSTLGLYGSDNNGMEVHTQPQLLVNIGKLTGQDFDSLLIGVEWYYHHNRFLDSSITEGVIKWIW